MTKHSRASLWIILVSGTITIMGGAIIAPVLNLMGEGLGVDPGAARVIITTHGIFIAIFSPLIGILIDRVGVRKPFILALILYGLAGGSGLIINNYWSLLVSRAFLGIAVATIVTSITVMVLNLYEGHRRNQVMGWRASFNSIGGVVWPILGGFLGTFSWRLPFAIYMVGLPFAFAALFVIPEAHKDSSQLSNNLTGNQESILRLFRNTPVLFVSYGLTFLANILLYAVVIFLPKLVEQFEITNTFYVGSFLSIMPLAGGLTALAYKRVRARLSYKSIVLVALALWAAGFAMTSQAFSAWSVVFAIALFGVGQGVVMPATQVWVGELVPVAFRGRISSYLATFGFVGQFLAPIVLNPVASLLGVNAVFLVVGVTCAVLLVLFLLLFRQ